MNGSFSLFLSRYAIPRCRYAVPRCHYVVPRCCYAFPDAVMPFPDAVMPVPRCRYAVPDAVITPFTITSQGWGWAGGCDAKLVPFIPPNPPQMLLCAVLAGVRKGERHGGTVL
ncbi:MAG: hypothetical protein IPL28_24295 [Chloroflexi bacterium]|nr:hypothetical protein [Chloroflexota bacterium]